MTTSASGAVHERRRFPFLRELIGVLAAYFAYFAVRGATEGDVALAMEHAKLVERFERGLGLFIEPRLQSAILSQGWLVDLANWVYVYGHWPVIAGVALWLYRSRPERYRLVRNAFLISGAIGLVVFTAFPVAPPRLADMGLVDTVVQRSNFYHVLQPPSLTNQYAALPSLHFGWNLLIGIALFREARHPVVRMIGVLLPVAMLAAVVLTANHYLVDTVAGGTIALVGLRLAYAIQSRRFIELGALRKAARWASSSFWLRRPSVVGLLVSDRSVRASTEGDFGTSTWAPQLLARSDSVEPFEVGAGRTAAGCGSSERGCGPVTRTPETAAAVPQPAPSVAIALPAADEAEERPALGALRLPPRFMPMNVSRGVLVERGGRSGVSRSQRPCQER